MPYEITWRVFIKCINHFFFPHYKVNIFCILFVFLCSIIGRGHLTSDGTFHEETYGFHCLSSFPELFLIFPLFKTVLDDDFTKIKAFRKVRHSSICSWQMK